MKDNYINNYNSINLIDSNEELQVGNLLSNKEESNNCIKEKAISSIFNQITLNEVLDTQVEGFIKESTENLIENLLENASLLAKHKEDETINHEHIYYSYYKLTGMLDPNMSNFSLYHNIKQNELNKNHTQDHKKRLELSKEENKNYNE